MSEIKTAPRICPLCGSASQTALYRQTFSTLSQGSLLTGYDVVACMSCGFGFADGLPSPETFERYYAEMSKYEFTGTGGKAPAFDQQRYETITALAESLLPDYNAPVLDIGCATGGLLATFKEHGYRRMLGVDPSPQCVRLAAAANGIAVHMATISHLDDIGGPFRIVVLAEVLEHLCDPLSALRQVRNALSDDGLLFCEVPDATGFAACLDAPFQQFSIEHINYFSPASLDNLLRAGGFVPVDQRQYIIRQSRLSAAPLLLAAYRKVEPAPDSPARDAETESALRAYITTSQRLESPIKATIDALIELPVLVWGVGTHTRHLLKTTRLAEVDIRGFIDSNPRYHGKSMCGVPILAPEEIAGCTEPIFISSCIYQEEIIEQIKERLSLENLIIFLYGAGNVIDVIRSGNTLCSLDREHTE